MILPYLVAVVVVMMVPRLVAVVMVTMVPRLVAAVMVLMLLRTLYLECGMGAAGDMLAAALLELLPDQRM